MTRLLPDRFYPVVDSAAWVQRLAAHGVRFAQLRIKSADPAWLRAEIAAALVVAAAARLTLVVNDHWRLALELGATWVHLGQEDLRHADLSAVRHAGMHFGLSTHSADELDAALACAPDYIALGPIYPTQLKVMPWAPHGTARLAMWKRRIGTLPLVAIGGITLERAAGCFAAGADALAMVGDIVRHATPDPRIEAWLRATREPT